MRGIDQRSAGIGDSGRPGIRKERKSLACGDFVEERLDLVLRRVLVQPLNAPTNSVRGKEPCSDACVLASQEVCVGQGYERPGRQVSQVAYGSRNND